MKRLILAILLLSAICILPCRMMAAVTLGSLTLSEIKCRIFTPNGDGMNDKARFEFDNPDQLPINGAVFDLSGARVGNLAMGTTPDYMVWDGRDADGKTVVGGIYIYQIEFQGKFATGTVVVAR